MSVIHDGYNKTVD